MEIIFPFGFLAHYFLAKLDTTQDKNISHVPEHLGQKKIQLSYYRRSIFLKNRPSSQILKLDVFDEKTEK
jgi:hypothetical protein